MNNEHIKKIARIVKCNESLVRKVLKGESTENTSMANKIRKAKQLFEDMDRELETKIREKIQRTFDETPDDIKKAIKADLMQAYVNGMWRGAYERVSAKWGYTPSYLRQIYPMSDILESVSKQAEDTQAKNNTEDQSR